MAVMLSKGIYVDLGNQLERRKEIIDLFVGLLNAQIGQENYLMYEIENEELIFDATQIKLSKTAKNFMIVSDEATVGLRLTPINGPNFSGIISDELMTNLYKEFCKNESGVKHMLILDNNNELEFILPTDVDKTILHYEKWNSSGNVLKVVTLKEDNSITSNKPMWFKSEISMYMDILELYNNRPATELFAIGIEEYENQPDIDLTVIEDMVDLKVVLHKLYPELKYKGIVETSQHNL